MQQQQQPSHSSNNPVRRSYEPHSTRSNQTLRAKFLLENYSISKSSYCNKSLGLVLPIPGLLRLLCTCFEEVCAQKEGCTLSGVPAVGLQFWCVGRWYWSSRREEGVLAVRRGRGRGEPRWEMSRGQTSVAAAAPCRCSRSASGSLLSNYDQEARASRSRSAIDDVTNKVVIESIY